MVPSPARYISQRSIHALVHFWHYSNRSATGRASNSTIVSCFVIPSCVRSAGLTMVDFAVKDSAVVIFNCGGVCRGGSSHYDLALEVGRYGEMLCRQAHVDFVS